MASRAAWIILDPPPDTAVMREEIFGPLLPVITYGSLKRAVQMLATLSRPLALYFLGGSADAKKYVLTNTYAGGGGVRESGMGR